MKYSFQRLNDDNLKHLIVLYSAVFGKNVSEDFVRKKYDTKYLGKIHLGYIAYDEKENPVAFNGAVPFRIIHKNKVYLGAQFGDAMTLPQHAGKGLFTKCGELSNALIKSENIPIIYGFPNQNSHYGYFNHLKWQKLHVIHRYEIKLQFLPISNIFKKAGVDVYNNRRENFFKKYAVGGILNNSAVDEGTAGTLRDEDFYQYKTFQDSRIVELANRKVWIKADKAILVGDIEHGESDKFWSVIHDLQKITQELGLNKIIFQTSPETFLDHMLSQKLQPQPSWTAGFLDLGADFDLKKLRFTYGDLDTF